MYEAGNVTGAVLFSQHLLKQCQPVPLVSSAYPAKCRFLNGPAEPTKTAARGKSLTALNGSSSVRRFLIPEPTKPRALNTIKQHLNCYIMTLVSGSLSNNSGFRALQASGLLPRQLKHVYFISTCNYKSQHIPRKYFLIFWDGLLQAYYICFLQMHWGFWKRRKCCTEHTSNLLLLF